MLYSYIYYYLLYFSIGVWGKRVRLRTFPQTGNALQEARKGAAKLVLTEAFRTYSVPSSSAFFGRSWAGWLGWLAGWVGLVIGYSNCAGKNPTGNLSFKIRALHLRTCVSQHQVPLSSACISRLSLHFQPRLTARVRFGGVLHLFDAPFGSYLTQTGKDDIRFLY